MRTLDDIGKKIQEMFSVKNVSIPLIALNLVSITLGIMYLLNPARNMFWEFFGVFLIITLFGNLLLVHLCNTRINRTSKMGNRLNLLCYGYLVATMLAMLGMALGNLWISVTVSNVLVDNGMGYGMVYASFFGLLGFGLLLALLNIFHLKNQNLWDKSGDMQRKEPKWATMLKKILKKILWFVCYLVFAIGFLTAFVTVAGSFEFVTVFFAVLAGQFGVYFSFLYLANTLILLKLKDKKKGPKGYKRIKILGIGAAVILMLPLCSTGFTIYETERQFAAAFGSDWEQRIPSNVSEHFLPTPFSTPEYFLGTAPKDCLVEEQVLFYNDTNDTDNGIQLYFDVYMPLNQGIGLPGQNSTLIRIHGGGWRLLDKGETNLLQINKYFAAQGYIVFDIQHGVKGFGNLLIPDHVNGDFDIDDMVRHVGIFIKYLSANAGEYGANLNSVFLSGVSSGGHLSTTAGWAIHNGGFTSLFGSNVTVKGIIPLSTANGMNSWLGVGESQNFSHPEWMIDDTSPPCLIFMGTHDILNYFATANTIKNAYNDAGNPRCALIWMPFGGHAFNIYYSSYYNQIFLYYTERFMYLYR